MSEARIQRRVDDLILQLKGLVHVRALLELRGIAAAELEREADRVRAELARLARIRAAFASVDLPAAA
jgi:hypothetical protein